MEKNNQLSIHADLLVCYHKLDTATATILTEVSLEANISGISAT